MSRYRILFASMSLFLLSVASQPSHSASLKQKNADTGPLAVTSATLTCTTHQNNRGMRVMVTNPTARSFPAGSLVSWRTDGGERGSTTIAAPLDPRQSLLSDQEYQRRPGGCKASIKPPSSGLSQ